MKVTWNWLAEFVQLEIELAKLAERLTMAGLEVESIEACGAELADVRCAEVVEVRPHPDAERLSVCDVRTSVDARVTVVCGAPNVEAGAHVAYAAPGATLPGGRRLTATDIRGVTSAGMLCSAAELGLGADASGILVLHGDAPIGERIGVVLGIEDTVLDIAITPNRGDCLSVIGLAREIAALTGQRLRRLRVSAPESDDGAADHITIRIDADDLCNRYVGRLITGVTIAPSPLWMQYRLRAVGLRPISNVVDVTNYVMIERGQPLHAFDFDRLPHKEIVVRRAGHTGSLTTLDGQAHELDPDDLVIASGDVPIALAGVMGGADSEVTEQTHRVLLESAWFAPSSVRRTAKRLGVRTEASYRFERNVDIEGVPAAADRAAALIGKLSGGTVARGRVDAYPTARPPAPIALRLKRLDDLLGMSVSRADVVAKLKALGASVSPATRGTVTVVPPSYRSDLVREIDVIEEVVRLVGYENVPASVPQCTLLGAGLSADERRHRSLKRFLNALGLSEVVAPSFCGARLNALFPGLGERRAAVAILNPMTQDDSEMRLSLCSSLVRVVRHNLDQGANGVAVFTIGKVFWRTDRFEEAQHLAAAVCTGLPMRGLGPRAASADFAEVKGIVESLLDYLMLSDRRWVPAPDHAAFHPGKTAHVEVRGVGVGMLGSVHPSISEELGLADPCWLFELDLAQVLQYCPPRNFFQDLPRFPAVIRDLAVLTDEHFAADQIVRFVREWDAGASFIEDAFLFDEYVGAPIPSGKKSLAYSIAYRAPDRTLTDAEVNDMHARLIGALTDTLQVEPR